MSRSKRLYILLGVLFAVSVLTFVISRHETRKEQIKTSGKVILEIPCESVTELSWENDGQTLSFQKKDGTWQYNADINFPVNAGKINGLLEQFQEFGAAFIIENVEDYGQYGLDKPACTIRVGAGEKSFEIQLGAFSKMDSQRYVSIGDGCVYLATHDPLEDFDLKLKDLIQHDEIPDLSEAAAIEFAGAESYNVVYEKDSTKTYCADDVYFTDGRPLDTGAVKAYLNQIRGLDLSDYASYNASETELKEFGLDKPELTVTVRYNQKDSEKENVTESFVLNLSRNPKGLETARQSGKEDAVDSVSGYARVGDSPIVYRVSADGCKKLLSASYDELRHKEVLTAGFADINRVAVSLDGNDYMFVSENRGSGKVWHYRENEELDIAAFQSALEGLKADAFTSEQPSQKEEISLIVYLNNENHPKVSIRLFRYDGDKCLAVVEGESVSLVPRSGVVALVEAVYGIVLQ